MTKSSRKWLLILGVGVTVAAAVALQWKPEKLPVYQGKTVNEWISLLDSQVAREKQRHDAAMAIIQIGSNAIPEIERILVRRHHHLFEMARGYAVRFGFAKPRPIHPLEF